MSEICILYEPDIVKPSHIKYVNSLSSNFEIHHFDIKLDFLIVLYLFFTNPNNEFEKINTIIYVDKDYNLEEITRENFNAFISFFNNMGYSIEEVLSL